MAGRHLQPFLDGIGDGSLPPAPSRSGSSRTISSLTIFCASRPAYWPRAPAAGAGGPGRRPGRVPL